MARPRPSFAYRYREYLRSYPGTEPARKYLDTTIGDLLFTHNVAGEKLMVFTRQAMLANLNAELRGTRFIPEGYRLLRMQGKVRCVNEVFRVYYPDTPGHLTSGKWRHSWRGMLFYYAWLLTHRPHYFCLSLKRKLLR